MLEKKEKKKKLKEQLLETQGEVDKLEHALTEYVWTTPPVVLIYFQFIHFFSFFREINKNLAPATQPQQPQEDPNTALNLQKIQTLTQQLQEANSRNKALESYISNQLSDLKHFTRISESKYTNLNNPSSVNPKKTQEKQTQLLKSEGKS